MAKLRAIHLRPRRHQFKRTFRFNAANNLAPRLIYLQENMMMMTGNHLTCKSPLDSTYQGCAESSVSVTFSASPPGFSVSVRLSVSAQKIGLRLRLRSVSAPQFGRQAETQKCYFSVKKKDFLFKILHFCYSFFVNLIRNVVYMSILLFMSSKIERQCFGTTLYSFDA